MTISGIPVENTRVYIQNCSFTHGHIAVQTTIIGKFASLANNIVLSCGRCLDRVNYVCPCNLPLYREKLGHSRSTTIHHRHSVTE